MLTPTLTEKIFNWFKKTFVYEVTFPVKYPEIKKGDFVITEWFFRDSVAEVREVNCITEFVFDNRYYLYILPLMNNGKRYNAKLTGFDFLHLKEYVGWFDLKDIKRLAAEEEIKQIKQQYPFWNKK